MKDKTTLFEYLYENLKEQIVSGRIKCGESLPSMNSVSEQYNIGIRTVKDVFRALSSEGYIKTEERKAAVVIYSDRLRLLSTAIIKTAKNQRLSMYWSVNHLLLKFIKPWPC